MTEPKKMHIEDAAVVVRYAFLAGALIGGFVGGLVAAVVAR